MTMTTRRNSVAGKSAPGMKRVPRGPGGKTIPEKDQSTKRQRRLATVRDPGADGNERGITRGEGDGLEWKNVTGEETEWLPAVYHNEIRQKLLVKASNDGQLIYGRPRRRGYLPYDETAFLSSQQHWGPDRSSWHHIPNDLLSRLDRLDHQGKDYELGYMFDEDTERIVMDKDNHPLVDYEDIPLVLSSNFGLHEEGYLLEAIRRIDMRIERTDFLARMPWVRKSKEYGSVLPIFTLSAIGNREYRWRKDNAIVAWTQRSGSTNIRAYIVNKLSQHGRINNTTRELVNGLTKEEKKEAEMPNKGTMMSKAGKRLLSDDVRKERRIKQNKPKKHAVTKRRSIKRKAPENFEDDPTVVSTLDLYQSDHSPPTPLPSLDSRASFARCTTTPTPLDPANVRNLDHESDETLIKENNDDSGDHATGVTADTSPPNSLPTRAGRAQDYRFKQPQSPADAMQIEEALGLTRHHWTDLFGSDIFGEKGPTTGYFDSYAKQYAALQKSSASLQPPGPVAVNLDHWGAWPGGFDQWKGTKISNEAFLRDEEGESGNEEAEAEASVNSGLFEEFTTGIF